MMTAEDWAQQTKELKRMRRLIVDMLAHCLHNVKHHHSEIVPVLRKEQASVPLNIHVWRQRSRKPHPRADSTQLRPENTYVIFTGWHRQQCVIVKPYITVRPRGSPARHGGIIA